MMRPHTLFETVARIREGTAVEIALGEFLDHFYTSDAVERRRSLAEEPSLLEDEKLNRLVAAIAEHLSTNYTPAPPPSWVEHPSRFSAAPWFTAKAPDDALKEYLTFASPAAFKRRNIMTEAAPLRRATTPRS